MKVAGKLSDAELDMEIAAVEVEIERIRVKTPWVSRAAACCWLWMLRDEASLRAVRRLAC